MNIAWSYSSLKTFQQCPKKYYHLKVAKDVKEAPSDAIAFGNKIHKIAQEYVDVETAKATGRTAFGEMVEYLKAHPSIRALLVEKTDRLYRNLRDWVTVDELDVEMHFPKEGVVLSRESRSSEKFMHGIKVLMAKNYIDNLSEEARKGMQEKAEQGIWPTKTPLGYRNITGPDGKKIIVTTVQKFPFILDELEDLSGKRFALLIDEAHSSQTGESAREMKAILGARAQEDGYLFFKQRLPKDAMVFQIPIMDFPESPVPGVP